MALVGAAVEPRLSWLATTLVLVMESVEARAIVEGALVESRATLLNSMAIAMSEDKRESLPVPPLSRSIFSRL